jgi:uncharacterized protein
MILQQIKSQFQCDWWGHHGVRHWSRVRRNGLAIGREAKIGEQGLRVVELFAVFHDACRVNEWDDPGHGPRGAALAHSMRDQLNINDWQWKLLDQACSLHTEVTRDFSLHRVIQVCLDADRLDIPRVGMQVDPRYLHGIKTAKVIEHIALHEANREHAYQRNRK